MSFFSLSLLANHYPALHGLRVLAIVSVIQVHVTLTMGHLRFLEQERFFEYSKRIFFGMDLFFVLSGFLIGTILLHSVDNKTLKGVGRFYLRRGFRTFPLYYFVLTGMILFYPMVPSRADNVFMEYLYLTNYGDCVFRNRVMHWGWSLSVEEHFYLAAPFFLIGLHALKTHWARISVLLVVWISGLVVRVIQISMIPKTSSLAEALEATMDAYFTTHNRFDILVAGIFLAYIHHYFGDRIAAILRFRTVRTMFYAVSLTCLFVLVYKPRFLGLNELIFALLSWGTITGIMYVPLILVLINTDGPFVRFLSKPVFLRIATLGYGIYLIHTPICSMLLPFVRIALRRYDVPFPIAWTALLIMTLTISGFFAYILHISVEKPALLLREHIVPRVKKNKPQRKKIREESSSYFIKSTRQQQEMEA
ncbi:MAG: acyltransferase [Proteobacteria bacterium]|nr:acyltransferase [Pseudomonadota bacterium]